MPDDQVLQAMAREAVRSGRLPSRAPDRTFGGEGSGETCALCGEPVRRDQLGFEVHLGSNRYDLHAKCLDAWERERITAV
jgi:hypothetical protein